MSDSTENQPPFKDTLIGKVLEGPMAPPNEDGYTGKFYTEDMLLAMHWCEDYLPLLGKIRRAAYHCRLVLERPDMTDIWELKTEEAPAALKLMEFENGSLSWADFVKKKAKDHEVRLQRMSPWQGNSYAKTDEKPNSWMQDTGFQPEASDLMQFNAILAAASPFQGSGGVAGWKHVGTAPDTDETFLVEIVTAFAKLMMPYIHPKGDDQINVEFRFGIAGLLFIGLGHTAFKILAQAMAANYADWDFWAKCTESELKKDLSEARRIHGYPASILRADGADIVRFFNQRENTSPSWLGLVVLLHILKYARFTPRHSTTGKPALVIIYKGAHLILPLTEEGVHQPLSAKANDNVSYDLLKFLGLPPKVPGGRNAFTAVAIAVRGALNHLNPTDLCRLSPLSDHTHIIAAPQVEMQPACEDRYEYSFTRFGVGMANVATIAADGVVQKLDVLTGPEVIRINWPVGTPTTNDTLVWSSQVPARVDPRLPSEIMCPLVRNIHDFGLVRGMRALLDGMMIADLIRPKLAGTAMGNAMPTEFPLFVILPTFSTLDESTLNGKTNLGRVVMGALCPGIQVTNASRSAGAPAQRAIASPIERFGTAIYDEFQLPTSHDHFLAQAGLQSLATGGVVTPGRALENSKGFGLSHPLCLTMKVFKVPPDIMNRSEIVFLDPLTAANRCTDDELLFIGTGMAAHAIRLSALRWIDANGFADIVKQMTPTGDPRFRFPAHLSIAIRLCEMAGGTAQEVFDYIEASRKHAVEQCEAASENGLADDIGVNGEFSAAWYFEQCSQMTIKCMNENLNRTPEMSARNLLRDILDNGLTGRHESVLREYGIRERSAIGRFVRETMKGKMICNGYRLEAEPIPGAKSHKANGRTSNRNRYRLVPL